ncbi:GntR family transcriptional regulator [Allonocardiopsis opalescens]|uniref:DNA-binding GntR family transcriptional regulator n=1 Tax=Allonocardiopsis opalescens TaxID=1144618 RepID=A0A2T0Q7P1_9ACTN|nr:GntR family transcriptional regulator [Allonocardiopsis opalescens]PRX99743.1 DNA-binding GntR family transcriptional regulator [Allonocardiopsis opalescens]
MPPRKTRTADVGPSAGHAVLRVVDGIKEMIVSGELLPGQQIRQEQMAAALGVSRLPVREGLRQLVADGLLTHEHNVGFAVARLSRSEFDQIYLMRRLLETEAIRALARPGTERLAEIAALAEGVERAAADLDLPRMRTLNSEFHLAIFGLSELNLVVAEIARIWTWALPYHSVYLHDEAARERILAEHRQMVDALADGDSDRLVELMDLHRAGSETQLDLMLRAGAAVRPYAG